MRDPRAPCGRFVAVAPGWLLLTASCGPATPLTPCHRALDDWCFHEESERGPVKPDPDAECPEEVFTPSVGSYRCDGRWDVQEDGGGFTGAVKYFDGETGELAGVEYWTDVNVYCGGFDFWYGRRIECQQVTCFWNAPDAERAGLPVCEG